MTALCLDSVSRRTVKPSARPVSPRVYTTFPQGILTAARRSPCHRASHARAYVPNRLSGQYTLGSAMTTAAGNVARSPFVHWSPLAVAALAAAGCTGDAGGAPGTAGASAPAESPGLLSAVELDNPAAPGSGQPFLEPAGDGVWMSWTEPSPAGHRVAVSFHDPQNGEWGLARTVAEGDASLRQLGRFSLGQGLRRPPLRTLAVARGAGDVRLRCPRGLVGRPWCNLVPRPHSARGRNTHRTRLRVVLPAWRRGLGGLAGRAGDGRALRPHVAPRTHGRTRNATRRTTPRRHRTHGHATRPRDNRGRHDLRVLPDRRGGRGRRPRADLSRPRGRRDPGRPREPPG